MSDDAFTYFNQLFESWLNRELGDIEIRAFRGKLLKQIFVNYETEAAKTALELAGEGFEVYAGVNLRVGERGTKDDVKYVTALHADVDYGAVGHKKLSLHANYNAALSATTSFHLKPSLIVCSGGGLQVYWLLNEAINTTEVGAEKIETIIKNISKAIGGDIGTQDISRILRVPGTFNLKIPSNPRPVTIVQNSGSKYELKDFTSFMSAYAAKTPSTQDSSWDGNFDALKITYATKSLIQNGVPAGQRSEAGYSVICSLVKAGYSDIDVFTIFDKYLIGEKYREKGNSKTRWLQAEINKARAFDKLAEATSRNKKAPVFSPTRRQGVKLLNMADLEKCLNAREITFIFRAHIPAGMPVIINGREGMGKTTICLGIAKEMLETHPEHTVVWIASEGFLQDTVDKMNKLGIDQHRFFILQHQNETFRFNFDLFSDRKQLDETLQASRNRGQKILAVFIDSIRGITPFDDNDSRIKNVMLGLNSLVCDKYGAALTYLDHLKKGDASTILDRSVGTTAKTAAVRRVFSVLSVSTYVRKIVLAKSNILGEPPGELYAALSQEGLTIYESGERAEATVIGQAEQFLIARFSERATYRASEIYELGERAGFSSDSLKKAKQHLNITAAQEGIGKPWYWHSSTFLRNNHPTNGNLALSEKT